MSLYNQIAVLSVPNQHTTEWHIEIAKEWGVINRKFEVSTIIIGENEINRIIAGSIKKKGGHILGIKFVREEISEPFNYDFILTLNEASNESLHDILKSCCGIIIIGNPANLKVKFKKLSRNNIISIDKVINNSSEKYIYNSESIPIFDSIEKGFIHIIQHNSQLSIIGDDYFKRGVQSRYESYPIGEKGEYLRTADIFFTLAFKSLFMDNLSEWNLSMANYYNSLGDHCYYHENDFFKAASYYSKALNCLKTESKVETDYNKEMIFYLISIITECAAFSFDRKIEDTNLAIYTGNKAINRYKYSINFSNDDTKKCYNHTIVGLKGWVEYLYAKQALKENDSPKALSHIKRAIKYYEKALNFLPQWKISGFSDNISISENEIHELLIKMSILKPSDRLDIFLLKQLIDKKLKGEKNY